MLAVLATILPVFLIVGSGFVAVRFFGFAQTAIDGLLAFAMRFAIPVLLFRGVYQLDFAAAFDWGLLIAYYGPAFAMYVLAMLLARFAWRRRPGEAAAIGFAALFTNTLLLGLPVLERAYGAAAMPFAFMIVAIHSPLIYSVGITVMELVRRDGAGPLETARRVGKAMLGNVLMIGIAAGFAVNLSGLSLPEPVTAAVNIVAASGLPAALFGMGGALTRYALRHDINVASLVVVLSLLVQPALAWGLASMFALPLDMTRAVVVVAAMPVGMNAYLFASMYHRAEGAAASAVLLSTTLSVPSIAFWLWALGGAAY
jgi:malonate transporter